MNLEAVNPEGARNGRLLIVEDDEGLAQLITRKLTRQGFLVDSVPNATAALEATTSIDFDLLLLDYQLPDMTGEDLIDRLQGRGHTAPFIVITGHGDEQIAVEIMKQGARDYLVKDYSFLDRLPTAVQQTCRQIETERLLRETEVRLQRSEKNAQALLDATAEVAMLIDRRGTILATNAVLADRLGKATADLVGAHVFDLLAEASAAALRHHVEQATRTRSMVCFEHSEAGRSLATSVFPVLDGSGEVDGVAVYSQDVTEQRKLADQLQQAQKMEAIGQLAGGIAHDFNNILQIILGRSALMAESLGSEGKLAEDLGEIHSSAERAAVLTRQLLVLSRRQLLQPQDVDLNRILEGLMNMIGSVVGETIRLEVFAGDGLRTVRADPGQIEQVLLNLCINARDAMPSGGRLTLETKNVILDEDYCAVHEGVHPGPYVQLTVSDSGVGMSQEVLEHIFEPFFTTKELGGGTGLGLATVYGIAKQHKGSIRVYSELGHGTLFTLLLPVAEPSGRAVVSAAAGDSVAQPPRGGTETLLLAEDDDGVRRLALCALQLNGYRVLEAANGDDALRILAENSDISLAVLDVVLPGLAGPELRESLLRVKPGLPMVFTTGYSARMDHVAFVIEKGHRVIQKPYSPAELARGVRAALDEEPSQLTN
jgi:PAS domain S-box-containing protein